MVSIAPLLLKYKLAIYVRIIASLKQMLISVDQPKLSHLFLYLGAQPSLVIIKTVIIVVASNNQQVATDNQANRYQAQVSQEGRKPSQMKYMHNNPSMLTLFLLLCAQEIV